MYNIENIDSQAFEDNTLNCFYIFLLVFFFS